MKSRVLVVGSVALDTVKTPFGSVKEALGGSATFFSASARFFTGVSLVAVVGKDFPARHRALIRRLGVDDSGLTTETGKTFRWKGYYDFNLNTAHTLKTELNVFQTFKPVLSARHRAMKDVFLANIDPELQLQVLKQVRRPDLVACDTMNYWIEQKPAALKKLLKHVNIFLCNDGEAREFSGEYNLLQAARKIRSMGPNIVVVKKGEHGVLCFADDFLFAVPAFLLDKVFDPTGAGDSFAGGFIGSLSRAPRLTEKEVRRAVIYGSVLASYNVESFSLERVSRLKPGEIEARFRKFREMTKF